MTTTTSLSDVIRHLTPTTLAALSVELHDAKNRTAAESAFLSRVDEALNCNVGEEEAEQHRQWVRDNI